MGCEEELCKIWDTVHEIAVKYLNICRQTVSFAVWYHWNPTGVAVFVSLFSLFGFQVCIPCQEGSFN